MAKVFLNAGHGGSDPGACAYGLKEKDINLVTMLACNEELVRHGVVTVMSRTTDVDETASEIIAEANSSGAELAVSFHANAGGGDGFEGYYNAGNTDGKALVLLCEKYVKEIGQNSRGAKTANLFFTRDTSMTAVLLESFFLDHDADNDIGDTEAEQKAFGVAYAKAILEYFGIAYKPETTKLYRVQIGAFSKKENALALKNKLETKGFDTYLVKVDNLFKVQVGAFSKTANAEAQEAKLKAAGFETYITTKSGTLISDDIEDVLTEGDRVKVAKNAPVWGKSYGFQPWVYNVVLYVREIDGNCITVSTQKTGAITGSVHKKYLTEV